MNQPTPNKRSQAIAVWILILFQFVLALAVTFDTLAWWAGKDLWSQMGLILIVFLTIASLPTFALPVIWEEIFKKSKDRPVHPIHRIGASACLALVVLVTLCMIPVYFFGARTVHSGNSRLVGYLVPGGHAKAVLAIDSPSLENSFDGTLSITAADASGAVIASQDYRVSNNRGSALSGHTITQYFPFTLWRTISIPQWAAGDLTLGWSSSGQTKVLEGIDGYFVLQASSGVAMGAAYFNNVLSDASGSFTIPANLYPPLLRQLVMLKESNLFLIYTGASLILIFSYMFLVRAKGIPEMTVTPAQPALKPQAPTGAPASAPKPAASPGASRSAAAAQPVDPDHVFGVCHYCGKSVKRDVVREYGSLVYRIVGFRCKTCGTVFCTNHNKELQLKFSKGYQANCPQCDNPLRNNITLLS